MPAILTAPDSSSSLSLLQVTTSAFRPSSKESVVSLRPNSPSRPSSMPSLNDWEVEISRWRLRRPCQSSQMARRQVWPGGLLSCCGIRLTTLRVRMAAGKRWLAPLIADILNVCFIHGRVPASISSGLVTPIHKKGCTLDPANYKPTAVGEPLYRLYTVILNVRLVHWTKQH